MLIMDRYDPDRRAEVEANAREWERLKRASGLSEGEEWKPYAPGDVPPGPHRPPCSCTEGGKVADGRCEPCWGWTP